MAKREHPSKSLTLADRFVAPAIYASVLERKVRESGALENPDSVRALQRRLEQVRANVGKIMTLAQVPQDVSLIERGIAHDNQLDWSGYRNDFSRAHRDGAVPLPR